MDVNSDTLDTAQSPQVVAPTTLARRAAYATPVNLRPNFCARRFSLRPSTARRDPVYPNHQVNSVRTKATRTAPKIFAIFVRTPVFSRTIFMRTKRQLRAHSHHLRAHSDTRGWVGDVCTACASLPRSHERTSYDGRLVELRVTAQYVGLRFPFCSRIEARQ